MHKVSFSGKLVLLPDENYIENELVGIDSGGCLAKIIKPLVEAFGNIVDVKYSFSAEKLSIEELQTRHDQHLKGEGKYLQGECWVEYETKHYGEYLSTTQEIEVGDYDLLGELEGRIGDYILLEIGFSKP